MLISEHVLQSGTPGKCAACKKETNQVCEQCHRHFCPECFHKYHHPKLDDE